MAYPLGKRRHEMDAQRFVAALCNEYSMRELANLCEVSARTVGRWKTGEDWPQPEVIRHLIDKLFPDNKRSRGEAPPYSPEMAIDGNTRVLGVSEYSLRAARGEAIHPQQENNQ